MIRIFAALLLVAPASGALHAADVITVYYGNEINWTSGQITARADASMEVERRGKPVDYYDGSDSSLNRARLDAAVRARGTAMERLISAAKVIRIDTEQSILDAITGSQAAQRRLTEVLSERVNLRTYPSAFDSAVCEARLSIGDLITALPLDFPGLDFPVIDDTPLKTPYSGLIIDGRGLGLKPMLFPSIYNDDGLELFGRMHIDSRYASRHGMVAYCYNEDDARKNGRAGRRPYFAVALKNIHGCPVISLRDTRKILGSDQTRNNLKKCRVVFILDRNGSENIAARRER